MKDMNAIKRIEYINEKGEFKEGQFRDRERSIYDRLFSLYKPKYFNLTYLNKNEEDERGELRGTMITNSSLIMDVKVTRDDIILIRPVNSKIGLGKDLNESDEDVLVVPKSNLKIRRSMPMRKLSPQFIGVLNNNDPFAAPEPEMEDENE